ncbi:MAG: hypothetical protein IT382_17650 [Deltaproteobacteria bacterium]|nr:hypothetical protein [Deltaproteobacteria bacterium]
MSVKTHSQPRVHHRKSQLSELVPPKPVEKAGPAAKTGTTTTPELPTHLHTHAPVQASSGHPSLFNLRLGQGQVKRLWDRVQGLVGLGDAASLRSAAELVARARQGQKGLEGLSAERFAEVARARMGALKGTELGALDTHAAEVFALSAEAARRTLGLQPHDQQLLAGALLMGGKVVEQYTGEGKTLSAVAPAALAALSGQGVHVATSSEYLARRDAELMAPVYNALGLSVAALLPDGSAVIFRDGKASPIDRKAAYLADVTYGTAAQLGFDHLRDNLAKSEGERVQRGHATLIMDEVDSLLIDDARTPLILAGKPDDPQAELRVGLCGAVEQLTLGEHLEFDRTQGTATLTDEGFSKLAGMLGLKDELMLQEPPLGALVNAAVRARVLLVNGIDYIVRDDKVELIGKNGEILPGRRLSAGLHQAIEAREGVSIQPETRTTGSITLREYLGLYQKVGGMTGTAEVSEATFHDVYRLDVVRVPTHKPLLRKDEAPRLFRTIEEKALALMADAVEEAKKGRPVLIGCPDERSVEALAALFKENGIPHQCLTAQNEAAEAKVIADAGRAGAITLSTPKGGRGVDFKLGGKDGDPAAHQAVCDAGGLMVLGFSPNSSARIDNQLRGRAGRQGEPGGTRFYASLEDRFFAQRELPKWVLERPPPPEGLEGRQVTALLDEHSALGESLLQGQLKDSLPYDAVTGEHRRRWLEQREEVMKGDVVEGMHGIVEGTLVGLIERTLVEHGNGDAGLWELYKGLAAVVPLPERKDAPPSWRGKDAAALAEHLLPQLHRALGALVDKLGPTGTSTLRQVLLKALDDGFVDHLDELDGIRAGIGWQQMAQKDPKLMYRQFAADAWREYMEGAQDVVTRAVMRALPPVELT